MNGDTKCGKLDGLCNFVVVTGFTQGYWK